MNRHNLFFIPLLVTLLVACTSAPTSATPTPWQNTVSAVSALTQNLEFPGHLLAEDAIRTREEFDVNEYLPVLNHLSVKPGYVLDYVYLKEDIGGEPIIYPRQVDQSPYPTYSDYVDAEGRVSLLESRYRFMDSIQVDGTAEGFFEFIVLRTMGSQFYQYWHAGYNDTTIICDRTGLEAALSAADNSFPSVTVPADVRQKAQALDFEPEIEFEDDTVSVSVVIFTKWGGFIEKSFTISQSFPHRVLQEETRTLVLYDCGVHF